MNTESAEYRREPGPSEERSPSKATVGRLWTGALATVAALAWLGFVWSIPATSDEGLSPAGAALRGLRTFCLTWGGAANTFAVVYFSIVLRPGLRTDRDAERLLRGLQGAMLFLFAAVIVLFLSAGDR